MQSIFSEGLNCNLPGKSFFQCPASGLSVAYLFPHRRGARAALPCPDYSIAEKIMIWCDKTSSDKLLRNTMLASDLAQTVLSGIGARGKH
jgi:hypothetical protein